MQQQDESTIVSRLDNLRANTNFFTKQIYIREQLTINVFVNHDKLDLQGKPINGEAQLSAEILPTSVSTPNPGHAASAKVGQEEEKVDDLLDPDSSDKTDSESEDELDLKSGADEESK